MKITPQEYLQGLVGKKVGFIGFGVSHRKLIEQYVQLGAVVTLRDRQTREQLGYTADELKRMGVRLVLGEKYLKGIDEDILFRTPGMRYFIPELTEARHRGVVVTSEMEMFMELCPCKVFGVTGSDGKTTSTTLIAELLKKEGYRVHVGGNIGKPLLPEIADIDKNDVAVVELSSFQLISMRSSPTVALVTNVAPNHLDMHADMQEYIDAKRNLLLHQGACSRTVLNADNDITLSFAKDVRGKLLWFSRKKAVDAGAYLMENGDLVYRENAVTTVICNKKDIRIPGMHNVENFLGVIAALWGYVSVQNIAELAREFKGVEHRLELVRNVNGVDYINDSIASSPTRTTAGLACFEKRVVLIAGGYDKKIPFQPLGDPIAQKVKLLILMGPTSEKIEKAVTESKFYDPETTKIAHVSDMGDAVELASQYARDGDTVLLSPACASFDIYRNFEVRGNHFKALVNMLYEYRMKSDKGE